MALPVRPPTSARRTPSITRASTGISRTRLAAAMVLLLSAAGLYGLTTHEAFDLDTSTLVVQGLRYTDAASALGAMGLADGATPNLFRLRTTELDTALRALPAVRAASVRAELPDQLRVTVEERAPILAWRYPAETRLVDVEGVNMARAVGEEDLPIIDDRRAAAVPPAPGARLAAMEMEVARLLAAVVPADLGSQATILTVAVTDEEGWVMETPDGWRAVFGFYTPSLRPPSSIPTQAACLAGILAEDGEAAVRFVTLSLSEEGCGTYVPSPTPSPDPSRPAGPSGSPGE